MLSACVVRPALPAVQPRMSSSWPDNELVWEALSRERKKHDDFYDKMKAVFPFQKGEGRRDHVQRVAMTMTR